MLPRALRRRLALMPVGVGWLAFVSILVAAVGVVMGTVSLFLGHAPSGFSSGFGNSVGAIWLTAAWGGVQTALILWARRPAWFLLLGFWLAWLAWEVATTQRPDMWSLLLLVLIGWPTTRTYFAVTDQAPPRQASDSDFSNDEKHPSSLDG